MRRLAALGTLLVAGCAAPLWERTVRLDAGRLFVPKTFAPLLPGSIYPDRSRPLTARGLPGAVVVARGARAREIAGDLGRRGVVVLVTEDGRLGPAVERLRGRTEAGGATGLFLASPDRLQLREAAALPDVRAIVVAGEPGEVPATQVPVLLLRTGVPAGPAPPGAAERFYVSTTGSLPAIALEDGADWLAAVLRGVPRSP